MEYLIWIIIFVIIFTVIGFIIFLAYSKHKKEKEFDEEMMRRLPDVEYTEIVSSSNGNGGAISTFNSSGGVGYGFYGSQSTTKFLVVYKSGDKQIVNLLDGSQLFNEYVRLLRK